MTDFLDEKRKEIDVRLKELKPLVEEYHRLEAAAAALSGVNSASQSTTPRRRSTSARSTSATGRRRGRPRGQGGRALQAIDLIKKRPGITIPEIADAMGIKQNYLYRVLPPLEKDGRIVKRDGGWHPVS